MSKSFNTEISLFSKTGQRKYLNRYERSRFYDSAQELPETRRLFCLLLFYTGARLTEVYSLQTVQIDVDNRAVVLRTLKKRQTDHFRSIPIPEHLIQDIQSYMKTLSAKHNELFYNEFSNRTARRIVNRAMKNAGIDGVQATSRGLRHGFAVACVEENVPLTQLQKWLGHSDIATTSIYLDVSGREEREWASRIW